MGRLFNDLYVYRSREKQERLEDFLTESIAAILRSLPAACGASALAGLTGQNEAMIAEIWPRLNIETQRPIAREDEGWQKPDLIISIGAEPWLLFENKVAHSIDVGRSKKGDIETQLHRYARWLRANPLTAQGLEQSLIFITHHTEVPADFLQSNETHPAYGELIRRTSSWGHFGRILDRTTRTLSPELHARVLVSAYREFLKEHRMEHDYPEDRDFAALAGFVERYDSWVKLDSEMIGRIAHVANLVKSTYRSQFDAESGSFYSKRYLVASDRWDNCTYISTGFWFPDRTEEWRSEGMQEDPDIGPGPKVFIVLGNDQNELGGLEGTPGEEWLRDDDIWAWQDVTAFAGDGTMRATAILAWIDQRVVDLKVFLAG